MKTAYKTNTYSKPPVISPFHAMNAKALDTQHKDHPVHEEIRKNLGTVNFSATFSQDTRTLEMFSHIPGVIAFTCQLRKNDQLIGEGHGSATISRINKFVERSVRFAYNASFLDAVARSAKMLDALYLQPSLNAGEIYKAKEVDNPITDKQKSYLTELVKNNVDDEDERNRWMLDIPQLSKDEASEAIQSFAN